MNIFRRSLGEDAVDRYNHTWSVMLLLVLALITWLLPLNPNLRPQPEEEVSVSDGEQKMPTYTAECWCPSQFTSSHVKYTEAVCATAFNRAVRGENETDGASLYPMMDTNIPFGADQTNLRSIPIPVSTGGKKMDTVSEKDAEKDSGNKKAVAYFTSVKTPWILFVLAVCLKLPHVIWTLLSGCAGINIDQVLQTATAGQILDKDSRRQLNQDLAHAVSGPAKSVSFFTSLLYLFFKLLMCVVAVAAVVVVHNTLLPEARNYGENVARHEGQESRKMGIGSMQPEQDNTFTNFCDFSIRQLQTVQRFTVQCVFTPQSLPWAPTKQKVSEVPVCDENKMADLGIYEALYTILLAFFVVLAVINVLSLLFWSARLVLGPCRRSVSSSSSLPVDIYLLLSMAQDNAGPLVACDLAENFSRGTEGERKEQNM